MTRAELMRTASQRVRFNSPLGEARARRLVAWVGEGAETLLDAGCGRGELALLAHENNPGLRVIGIDVAGDLVALAEAEANRRGTQDAVSFLVRDAGTWTEPVDAAMCVGSEHAFGGLGGCVEWLAAVAPAGRAALGASYYQSPPNSWCLEAFGPLPSSLDEVCDIASNAGWQIQGEESSTMEEWDAFECAWQEGCAVSGTSEAQEFAETRRREYEKNYRSVLGFAWLRLSRTASP